MAFKRVVVYGAGAVGSYLGARLSAILPVIMIARQEHVEAVKGRGLFVGGKADIFVPPGKIRAMTGISSLPDQSLVIVSTKLSDMSAAGLELVRIARPDSLFLLIQNGLNGRELFLEGAGAELETCRSIASCGVDFRDPGKVDYWGGGISFEQGRHCRELVETFSSAGIECSVSDNFEQDLWTKLAANCVINPLTALLEVRNSGAMSAGLRDVRQDIVNEVRAVAASEGVELPADLTERLSTGLQSGGNRSSMLQDLSLGRPTEIEYLNGYIVRLGSERGIPVPVNRCLTCLVRERVSNSNQAVLK